MHPDFLDLIYYMGLPGIAAGRNTIKAAYLSGKSLCLPYIRQENPKTEVYSVSSLHCIIASPRLSALWKFVYGDGKFGDYEQTCLIIRIRKLDKICMDLFPFRDFPNRRSPPSYHLTLPLPISATGGTLQPSGACVVPPAHLKGVDEKDLLLTLHNGVEAHCTQPLKLLVEEDLSKRTVNKIRTGRLWKVLSDNDCIGSGGGVVLVTGSDKVAR